MPHRLPDELSNTPPHEPLIHRRLRFDHWRAILLATFVPELGASSETL